MFFNTIQFGVFFITVFLLYWFVFNKTLKKQNLFLVACSYLFYACWDWRFMFLLAFSTLLGYFSGLQIEQADDQKNKKRWLIIGVILNLGLLFYFKYFNFFIDSFAELLQFIGFKAHYSSLKLILPVGISFYTFHNLSYIFDIYNGKTLARKSVVDYTLFVSFFPLLVSGPIERATHLLPQIERKRSFNYHKAVDGSKQILWGLFKKIVIADTCAGMVDVAYSNINTATPSTLILGAIMFSFQIYGDFSGYTDIALGTARLLGFELLQNFRFPYFSRDMAEFWRRWHISLSSWFKDYLYIPLGGSRRGTRITIRNTFIIFLVSGFWHGANWTFLLWGGLNALCALPGIVFKTKKNRTEIVAENKILPSIKELIQMLVTFILTCVVRIFFRSESIADAFTYIKNIFSQSWLQAPKEISRSAILIIFFFMLIEWFGRYGKYGIEKITVNWAKPYRWSFYYILLFCIYYFSNNGRDSQFIYFQF